VKFDFKNLDTWNESEKKRTTYNIKYDIYIYISKYSILRRMKNKKDAQSLGTLAVD
jgi:hypothetical protein